MGHCLNDMGHLLWRSHPDKRVLSIGGKIGENGGLIFRGGVTKEVPNDGGAKLPLKGLGNRGRVKHFAERRHSRAIVL